MIIGCAVLFGIGLVLIVRTWAQIQMAWSSRSWVATQGTICQTTIDYQGARGSASLGKHSTFFANVIYRYAVHEKEYTNDRRCFGNDLGSESQALSTASHYPEGSTVNVVYNPNNPKQSVLEPGLGLSQCVPIGIGAMLIGGGWLGLVQYYGYPWIVG